MLGSLQKCFKVFTFKDAAEQERPLFLNLSEFGEVHKLNDIEDVPCVIDEDAYSGEDFPNRFEGVYKKCIALFVLAESIHRPEIDEILNIDDDAYKVVDVIDESRLYEIVLERLDY